MAEDPTTVPWSASQDLRTLVDLITGKWGREINDASREAFERIEREAASRGTLRSGTTLHLGAEAVAAILKRSAPDLVLEILDSMDDTDELNEGSGAWALREIQQHLQAQADRMRTGLAHWSSKYFQTPDPESATRTIAFAVHQAQADVEVEVKKAVARVRSRQRRELAAEPASQPGTEVSPRDGQIIDALRDVLPSAADSYEQAVCDLQQKRLSWRGPVADLREALRSVLDHLAPMRMCGAAPGTSKIRMCPDPPRRRKRASSLSVEGQRRRSSRVPPLPLIEWRRISSLVSCGLLTAGRASPPMAKERGVRLRTSTRSCELR